MLSDTALFVTGVAFASILGGAWWLRRRSLAAPPVHEPPSAVVRAASERPAVAPAPVSTVTPVETLAHATPQSQSKIETLVLKAALEDALGHLAEVYGPDYLDAFQARRIKRNVEPYRKLMSSTEDASVASQGLRQAAEAEEALALVVAAVRKNPRIAQA